MPREIGPERAHFGGEGGLVTETSLGKTKCFWRCQYCHWTMGGKNFQNAKARIHLSSDQSLRNGMVAQICTAAPPEVMQQMSKLERTKRANKVKRAAKKRRAHELLNLQQRQRAAAETPPRKQSKLELNRRATQDEVDRAWGEAFFGLDIAAAKIDNPLFREALHMTKKSKSK